MFQQSFTRMMRKPILSTRDAFEFLRTHDKMASLLPNASRMMKLQADCSAIFPNLFHACHVVRFLDGQLVLSTPNSALATKLKQQVPKLQEELQKRGWQIEAIRLKVQFGRSYDAAPASKNLHLSDKALSAISNLGSELENTPRNAALKAALEAMINRHKRR